MAPPDCYRKALDLLARRPHFRGQLEEKLRAREYSEEEVGETLERLQEIGLLDDERVAADFVEGRLRRGPIGRRRMRLELEKRRASESALESALESAYAELSDLEGARTAAERWASRRRGDSGALARHLDRQGFTGGSILTVVRELEARREEEDL